jgi:hypothetical protein
MAYPAISFEDNPAKDKPNVLAVADSYYWNIFNTRLPQNLFNNEAFWYFNSLVYPDYYYKPLFVKDLDLKTEVEKQGIILIMVTERFLFKYDWRFVDNIFELYTPELEPDHQYNYENEFRMNLTLFDRLAEDAKKSDLTLEEIIHREADFMFLKENLEKYLEIHGSDYYKKIIEDDTAWMKTIVEKAKAQGRSVEAMLNIDADYMFKTEYPRIHEKFHAIKNYENQIQEDSLLMKEALQEADYYRLDLKEMIWQKAYTRAETELQTEAYFNKVKEYENMIKDDPQWLEAVKKKAGEQGLSLDEMIRQDAIWMLEQENSK